MSTDIRAARLTGAAYLGLALTGMAGFLLVRPQLTVEGDPAASLALRLENPQLAQLGIVLELLIVIAQAAVALGFFAILRERPTAAFGTAVFGMANAAAILASATLLMGAQHVAGDASLAPGGDSASAVALLMTLSAMAWDAGAIFFGLWLIPIGVFALTTNRLPRVLGWLLIVGGIGYTLSSLLGAALPDSAGIVAELLVIPATIAEFWTIGYLLIVGIRASTPAATPSTPRAAAIQG